MTPTLMTPIMIGKPICAADLGAMLLIYRDPMVMATLSADGKPFPEQYTRDSVEAAVTHWQNHGFGLWLFCHNTNGNFLGYAGLRHAEVEGKDEVELLYALRSPYWGSGLGTQMAKAVVDVGFNQIELETIVAYTLTGNQKSQRLLKRLGFSHEKDFQHADPPHVLYRRNV